jgi:putative FmdB family regulatory protein
MPLYAYQCPDCGEAFDRLLPLARYKDPQQCTCGATGVRLISPARVVSDYAGYVCPVEGTWIEGRKAHRENLAKHGCRVLESGEVQQAQRARVKADEEFERKLTDTAVEVVAQLPPEKREQLGKELTSGSVTVTRG